MMSETACASTTGRPAPIASTPPLAGLGTPILDGPVIDTSASVKQE